jgi:peptidoglycan/xylan/chitin deacetylase (PgdA/CDA1 family)
MTLRSKLGKFRAEILSTVSSRPLALHSRGPIVSFCFDDFPRTAYTTGGAILKSFGVHGTYYAALGLMNTTNELGDQLRQEDIDSLLADGHELGSHTFSHVSCRAVSLKSFETDVLKGRQAIRALTGCDAGNFAYPRGHVSIRSKKRIGALMSSCRGIYGGINDRTADLNLLRANSLYGDVDQRPRFEALLLENVSRCGWLIFYTHDVRRNPSAFGCTPEIFDQTVSMAAESGCRIVSIKEALDLFSKPSS